ncbi:hypothetical protein CPB84DRAFT_1963271 [Gymnopilus junonius]|uniref:Uncharacterized protein n=1 Tax=Gymnopilus junonius TaxID=109634 RepID=A0A9P5TKZ7_GYMJU|nr:hypothetical protein CPB84DRAFT_1963271 [Gymnopilus junonius]
MLKRQRRTSPFLPSSIPLISDSPDDFIDRDSKRRRTTPPVLDGPSRGWTAHLPQLEDDEEYYDDEYPPSYNQPLDPSLEQTSLKSEYKSANAILRELHVLHQHRLLFPPSDTMPSGTYNAHPPTPTSPHFFLSEEPPLIKCHVQSPPQDHQRTTAFTHTSMVKDAQQELPLLEEVSRVTERYESINKFLGSLFISRRRVLDTSDEIHGR